MIAPIKRGGRRTDGEVMGTRVRIRIDPAPRGGVGRLVAVLSLSVALMVATAGAVAPRATAAEPGVVVSIPSASQIAAVKALGTHWVRMFVSWRALQPTPAPVAPSALTSYELLFNQLPAGTKVILDVVGAPQWETGSTDEHSPPARPGDYAAFVAILARRWGAHVAAYAIWNEEDESRWW